MRAPGLQIATTDEDGSTVVRVAGELDIDNIDGLVDVVVAALAGGSPVSLDLVEVSFVDSSGVAGLNRCRRAAAADGAGALGVRCRRGGPVARLLDWTGLADHLALELVDAPG